MSLCYAADANSYYAVVSDDNKICADIAVVEKQKQKRAERHTKPQEESKSS